MRLIRTSAFPIVLSLTFLLFVGCAQSENEAPSSDAISSPEPTSVPTQPEPRTPTATEVIPSTPANEIPPEFSLLKNSIG